VDHLSATIAVLRKRIALRELSATALCEEVLATIERDDPRIRAMSDVIASSALKEAGDADRAAPASPGAPRLDGVPIVVKSNIDVTPAVCDAGLPHIRGHRPIADAEVVVRLRAAGAVIVGTAETDSGGFGVTTPRVTNPSSPRSIAGGSSGGAAAAVAARFCKAAIGTDTGGSVRIPAACCGIVGFKPTFARVSTRGVRPLVPSADHVGVLAATVEDVRSVMDVIDPGFPELPPWSLSGLPVIGIATSYLTRCSPEVADAFSEWMMRCVEIGCAVREVELPDPDETLASHLVLSLSEAALAYADDPATVARLPEAARESIQLGLAYGHAEHLAARHQLAEFSRILHAALERVDVLALPTLPIPVPDRASAAGDHMLKALIRFTSPFNQSGHPALAMPWVQSPGGDTASIQLVGRSHQDRQLLEMAMALEQRLEGFGKKRRQS
jgi:aspartyl-tRNA(Asn)/glutamyl-tRNA(Gln) amidotransferase subunit A